MIWFNWSQLGLEELAAKSLRLLARSLSHLIAHTALNLAERGQAQHKVSSSAASRLAQKCRDAASWLASLSPCSLVWRGPWVLGSEGAQRWEGTGRCSPHGAAGRRSCCGIPRASTPIRALWPGSWSQPCSWERYTACATPLIRHCFTISLCQKHRLLFRGPPPRDFVSLLKIRKVCAA